MALNLSFSAAIAFGYRISCDFRPNFSQKLKNWLEWHSRLIELSICFLFSYEHSTHIRRYYIRAPRANRHFQLKRTGRCSAKKIMIRRTRKQKQWKCQLDRTKRKSQSHLLCLLIDLLRIFHVSCAEEKRTGNWNEKSHAFSDPSDHELPSLIWIIVEMNLSPFAAEHRHASPLPHGTSSSTSPSISRLHLPPNREVVISIRAYLFRLLMSLMVQ